MHSHRAANQQILALRDGQLTTLDLPSPSAQLGMFGLSWGDADEPLTPAYWAAQTWMWQIDAPHHYKLGRSLAEELLACMLGGYGIPAEVGLAAYQRLREHHLSGRELTDQRQVEELLAEPLEVGGRRVRYRFARQKALYVTGAFRELGAIDEGLDDIPLRDRLMAIRGIGPKTASWVVRNLRASDGVAILDIHILRAGRHLGIFEEGRTVERHYAELEAAYLAFASAIGTRASILDSVMWMTMRQLGERRPASLKDGPGRGSKTTVPGAQGQLAF